MKKTLLEFVQDNEKDYPIRIKTTFELDSDALDRVERHLKKYDVIEVSKPERIMLQANPIDFPENHGWEIYITDAVTRLPVSYDVLQAELVKLLCVHASQIKVRNPNAPREEEAEAQEEKAKEEFETIKNYEKKSDDESILVYELDKVLTVLNLYLDDGYGWRKLELKLTQIIEEKRNKVKKTKELVNLLEIGRAHV